MKKIISILIICIVSSLAFAQDFPARSTRLVNDFSNTLSSDEINTLEHKLVAYNDSTSSQVAIVLVKSLNGYEVSDYAVKLAEQWGIGKKEKDNGVLILAAIDDRKITIQTGYGMEGVLPDAICKRIIEQEIKPAFKSGNYYQGLDQATSAIFKFAAGEYTADNYGKQENSVSFGVIIVLFILFVFLMSRSKRNHQNFGTRGRDIPFWMLMMGGGGRGSGSWSDFSGGSRGGGGFGGFGGGSFGGGGASGSW
jgi:uncharacterized protein